MSFVEPQHAKFFRYMKVRLRCACGLPGEVRPWFRAAFDAIEVCSPGLVRAEMRRQRGGGNRKFRGPHARLPVQEDRSPEPALQISQTGRRNIEVNPHPVGRDFKFLVVARARGIRLQESLRHVAVPKMISAPVCFRIFKNAKLAIAALKPEVEMAGRPQKANLGLP